MDDIDINDPVFLVEERIRFIKKLIDQNNFFRDRKGHKIYRSGGDNVILHPYTHYSALLYYLSLTCFDILGQPDEWIDFSSWLESKKGNIKKERELQFEKVSHLDLQNQLIEVHNFYKRKYGFKNSFFRFIDEILDTDQRRRLFETIDAHTIVEEGNSINESGDIVYNYGKQITEDYSLTEKEKKKFLLNIRNYFTHKGVSIGDYSGGIFYFEDDKMEIEHSWYSREIYRTRKGENQKFVCYSVYRWPQIFITLIEEVLKNKTLI